MNTLQIALIVIGLSLVFLSLLPFIKHDNWIFRLAEYPRFQKFVAMAVTLSLYLALYFREFNTWDWVFSIVLFLNLIYLFYHIYPYTPISKKNMMKAKFPIYKKSVKFLITNVYQPNRKHHKLVERIRQYDPDIVIAMEVDKDWQYGLKSIERKYPYIVACPLNNQYGMMLYSKLELIDEEIKFLIDKEIPSIHTNVKLRSGDIFRLYCIHPTPPVPGENYRSTDRDKEILMVGYEANKLKMPVIVAGDLNDVAWSFSTSLFLRLTKFLDPRRGRGFYDTFHAKIPFFRWPLDHVFCSPEWQLVNLKRVKKINSDHFPIFIELTFKPHQKYQNEQIEKEEGDDDIAKEKINHKTSREDDNDKKNRLW